MNVWYSDFSIIKVVGYDVWHQTILAEVLMTTRASFGFRKTAQRVQVFRQSPEMYWRFADSGKRVPGAGVEELYARHTALKDLGVNGFGRSGR